MAGPLEGARILGGLPGGGREDLRGPVRGRVHARGGRLLAGDGGRPAPARALGQDADEVLPAPGLTAPEVADLAYGYRPLDLFTGVRARGRKEEP